MDLLNITTTFFESLTKNRDNCSVMESSEGSDMPGDFFTQEQRLHGAILVHVMIGIYCFTLLAVIVNDFFLPAVECIVKSLNLSEDVGAATFMSIATSAPEFFVSLTSVFISKSDVGLGTIVGSSAFNLLGVGALGGLAAIKPIKISKWPLTRDCSIYALCVSVLVFVIWDNRIYWYEALLLVVMYISYFVFMFSNKKILRQSKKWMAQYNGKPVDVSPPVKIVIEGLPADPEPTPSVSSTDSETPIKIGIRKAVEFNVMDYGLFRYYEDTEKELKLPSGTRKLSFLTNPDLKEEAEPVSLCSAPHRSGWLLAWWIYTWPIRLILLVTLPDCKKYPRLFPITFIMCIVWIGLNSFMVTWMVSIIAMTFEASEVIMGMTFLAAGGCLPEAISIIIVARKGAGGMGFSNALGANTMDILMCLGLIWFIKCMELHFKGEEYFAIQSAGINYIILTLLIGVAILYTTFRLSNFYITKKTGVFLLMSYIVFISFAIFATTNSIFSDSAAC